MAKPLTAAITGFSRAPDMNGILDRRPLRRPARRCCSNSFMSSPAQKPRPVPVKIATSSSVAVAELGPGLGELGAHLGLRAFSRSGRFMRTTRTWP